MLQERGASHLYISIICNHQSYHNTIGTFSITNGKGSVSVQIQLQINLKKENNLKRIHLKTSQTCHYLIITNSCFSFFFT